MKNKKKNLRTKYEQGKIVVAILLIITAIGVGYASLGANLKINGVANFPSASWDVHFKTGSIAVTSGSVTGTNVTTAATITNATQVNYAVTLALPGDFYEFTVKAENTGTIDAMIDSIVSKKGDVVITTGTLPSYISYSVTYADGMSIAPHHLLAKNTEETYKVRIEFKKDIEASELPQTAETLNLNFQINYVQSDNSAIQLPDKNTRLFMNNNSNIEQVNISTNDHNNEMRFIGSNPNNYVIFNNEATCDSNQENCSNVKWRIIGVFDGQLKLIRNESIGRYLAWDSNVGSNNNYGINQWGPSTNSDNSTYEGADLMKLLNPGYENNSFNNSLYWTGGSGNCYNDPNESYQSCNFAGIGLTDTTSRAMIDDTHEWKTGFVPTNNVVLIASTIYNHERSNNTGKQCTTGDWCSDLVNRRATWTGRVGLIYMSDYLYATNGGNTTSTDSGRNTCLGQDGKDWGSYTNCASNNWLHTSNYWQYTISSTADTDLNDLLCTDRSGAITISGAAYTDGSLIVKPVVYLKSNVKIVKGEGTSTSPFVLSNE